MVAWVRSMLALSPEERDDYLRGGYRNQCGYAQGTCNEGLKSFCGKPRAPASMGELFYPRISKGQEFSAPFLDFLLPWLSAGLDVVDAMRPERRTIERHMDLMGQLAFPYGLELSTALNAEGKEVPSLMPTNKEHVKASKCFARISTLCHMGENVAKEVHA